MDARVHDARRVAPRTSRLETSSTALPIAAAAAASAAASRTRGRRGGRGRREDRDAQRRRVRSHRPSADGGAGGVPSARRASQDSPRRERRVHRATRPVSGPATRASDGARARGVVARPAPWTQTPSRGLLDGRGDGPRRDRVAGSVEERDVDVGRGVVVPPFPSLSSTTTRDSSSASGRGSYTSERRGGVERRQAELKGVEGGD